MCGFAGILTDGHAPHGELEASVRAMSDALAHRGPDDSGVHVDAEAGLGLGFRRLAVIDLSPAGHQPMRSDSGRHVIVFNGEIYNYRELRSQLRAEGVRFHSDSDTEVVVASVERWGVPGALERLVGMFAFAVWDTRKRTLTLVRDRLGIKPLYVHGEPGRVLFGSELKALCRAPGFRRTVDRDALVSYLRFLYVPAPRSIYRDTIKLLPGHYLTLRSPLGGSLPEPTCYWSLEEVAKAGCRDRREGQEGPLLEELDALLQDAVARRMVADVPVGALLSGGIDSSLVVAAMQQTSDRAVRTFTVAFDQGEHDESARAREVATHLGTEHLELPVRGEDALSVIPNLPEIFDEPLANPSEIPTYMLCRLARRHVTVALAGDGGDEVFGGYNRYRYGNRILPLLGKVPVGVRSAGSAALSALGSDAWERWHGRIAPVLPEGARPRLAGNKLSKLGRLMAAEDLSSMYRSLLSAWEEPETLLVDDVARSREAASSLGPEELATLLDRMMFADQSAYLPDDLLAKVDRASMATSLEVRVPLLDHRVVELAWRLPEAMRIRRGETKWALRRILESRVPREMWDRPKVGFTVPLEDWLRGPLAEWAGDLLASDRLERGGLFRARAVRRAWDQFRKERGELAPGLWAILTFEAWRDHWEASSP